MIDPGTCLEISYPITTHVRQFPIVARRRRPIMVYRVRDLVRQPLTVAEFLRRPFIMRSRWLVTALDDDLGEIRQFYLGSSDEYRAPGTLRVALYEPRGNRPCEWLGPQFGPTVQERRVMMHMLRRWSRDDYDGLQLRICCTDLRLVS